MRSHRCASSYRYHMDDITTRKPLLIVCADPLNSRRPDAHFAAEVGAAERAGFEIALFSYEQLTRAGDAWRIVELGDGQVAGLLPAIDLNHFYRTIHQALQEHADG
jgi:hypothetical protein